MLQADAGISVVTEASTVAEALERLDERACDIVLMDLSLPDADGLACIRSIRARGAQVPILVVTMHTADTVVHDALEAGANGYVLKTVLPDELRRAVAEVAGGGSYVHLNPVAAASRPRLSELEQRLLTLTARGQSLDELGLSRTTLASHVRSVCRKLAVDDLAGAVERAVRESLVLVDPHERRPTGQES